MLCSTLIQHAHTLFVDHRKELIHFGWWARGGEAVEGGGGGRGGGQPSGLESIGWAATSAPAGWACGCGSVCTWPPATEAPLPPFHPPLLLPPGGR